MFKTLTLTLAALTLLTGCAAGSPYANVEDKNFTLSEVSEGFSVRTAEEAENKLPFTYVHTRYITDTVIYSAEDCTPYITGLDYGKDKIDPVSGDYVVKVFIKKYSLSECSGDIVPHVQNITFAKEDKLVDFQNTKFKYCIEGTESCWDFVNNFYRAGIKLDKEE